MATVMLWLLVVCLALLCVGAWLASGAWSMALGMLGPTAPSVIVVAVIGAALMAMTVRTRTNMPVARVIVRRSLAKGASV